jgi:L-amino acid N-acyltransferase YncA
MPLKLEEITLRDATLADLPRIVEIYNASIPGGWSTADTVPISVESRLEWFKGFTPQRHPLWVALLDTQIVGWIALFPFRHRPAYDATAEVSTYIAPEYQRQGLGRFLKVKMLEKCPALGITTVISVAFDHNEATRRMNTELGFLEMGHLPEICLVQGQQRGIVFGVKRIGV